jgi:hypothetical protein
VVARAAHALAVVQVVALVAHPRAGGGAGTDPSVGGIGHEVRACTAHTVSAGRAGGGLVGAGHGAHGGAGGRLGAPCAVAVGGARITDPVGGGVAIYCLVGAGAASGGAGQAGAESCRVGIRGAVDALRHDGAGASVADLAGAAHAIGGGSARCGFHKSALAGGAALGSSDSVAIAVGRAGPAHTVGGAGASRSLVLSGGAGSSTRCLAVVVGAVGH